MVVNSMSHDQIVLRLQCHKPNVVESTSGTEDFGVESIVTISLCQPANRSRWKY